VALCVELLSSRHLLASLQVQRARLLKQVAIAYVTRTVGKWMVDRFEQLQGRLEEADDLQELAATSAGLKGHCTFLAAQGIEECRKCCGGNGYLLNRFPLAFLSHVHSAHTFP
jgi:acyl-CoA oxidase